MNKKDERRLRESTGKKRERLQQLVHSRYSKNLTDCYKLTTFFSLPTPRQYRKPLRKTPIRPIRSFRRRSRLVSVMTRTQISRPLHC